MRGKEKGAFPRPRLTYLVPAVHHGRRRSVWAQIDPAAMAAISPLTVIHMQRASALKQIRHGGV